MDETRIRRLLGGPTPDRAPGKYDGLADPAGAEELGRELAARLREVNPTAIAVWEDPEDVVLGHVVGRELGLTVVRTFNADGLVGHSRELPAGARVALVTDAVRDPAAVMAVRAFAERSGAVLVATAVLVETGELRGVAADAGTVVALVRQPDESVEPAATGGATA